MGEPNGVDLDVFFRVLSGHGVAVSETETGYKVAKGDILEEQALGHRVSRRMVARYARKFGIAIHEFYHPVPKVVAMPAAKAVAAQANYPKEK